MTDYSKMNVHQLMEKAVDIGTQYGHAVWKDGCEEMDALESALRKVVIREASVGQVFFTTDKHPVAIGAKELKVGGRTFDLILKETSGERPY